MFSLIFAICSFVWKTGATKCSGTPATSPISSNTHQYASDDTGVDVVAFSSCYKPSTVTSNTVWNDLRNNVSADLFLWIGDNAYSDGTNMETKRQAYNAARDQTHYVLSGPVALPKIPVMGTWDDHDFGANNQGNDYTCVKESQDEFVWHLNVPITEPMHPNYAGFGGQRRGVYNSRMFKKPDGIRNGIHVIMLDARSDRDPTYSSYGTCKGANTRMLSEAQWAWLDSELNRTSEIKIIASGIQVLPPTDQVSRLLTSYCAYDGSGGTFLSSINAIGESSAWKGTSQESWGEIPQEKAKLLRKAQKSINDGKAKQVIFVSGDQHWAELMAKRMPTSGTYGVSQVLYEVTGSGINQNWIETIYNSNRLRQTSADTRGDGIYINACVFPFIYGGVSHYSCTLDDSTVPWCSTATDNNGNHVFGQWGNCQDIVYELFQNGGSNSTHTCSQSKFHVCSATANYGVVSVDWVSETVKMSIRTPHHSGEEEAAWHQISL